MIFNVRRASGFPICLEPEEQHCLNTLEEQGRWLELEEYERTLRHSDALKDLKIQTEKLEELLVFINSIGDSLNSLRINFAKKEIVIEDQGDEVQ